MLLILAHWPTLDKDLEGMGIRIKDIDLSFSNKERIYLQLGQSSSIWPRLVRTEDFSRQSLSLNLKNPLHLFYLALLLVRIRAIYAHSILNLASRFYRILFSTFKWIPLILDVHGVVPEEFEYSDKKKLAEKFELVEAWAAQRTNVWVCVSSKMQKHLQKKYNLSNMRWVLIPTQGLSKPAIGFKYRATKEIVYSGGLQKWQKPEETLNLLGRMQKHGFSTHFYTYDLAGLENLLSNDALKIDAVSLKKGHLNSSELADVYSKVSFGLVLRDNVLVNRVSCPTKILDYLAYGIIPVVLSKEIGDFQDWEAPLLEESDLHQLDEKQILEFRAKAMHAYSKIQDIRKQGQLELEEFLNTL